jgi:hypothetical protein
MLEGRSLAHGDHLTALIRTTKFASATSTVPSERGFGSSVVVLGVVFSLLPASLSSAAHR